MILSVLIATIESRQHQFVVLKDFLEKQIEKAGLVLNIDVEIVSECDNKQISVGLKRQMMLARSLGDYVCHIDDDDWVADDYISRIVEATKQNPDCIGFNVLCQFGTVCRAIVSNRYNGWFSNVDGYEFVRSPNHLAVIKREHALQIGFKDMRAGEDSDFSHRMVLAGLLKTEVFVDTFQGNNYMYTYRYKHEPQNTKFNIR